MVEGWIKESDTGKLEFSFGEGKDKEKISGEPLDCLKTLLSKRPKVTKVGKESGSGGEMKEKASFKMPADIQMNQGDIGATEVAGVEQMNEINAYMKENKCDFMEAYCAYFEVEKPAEPDASSYSMTGDSIIK